MVCRISIDITHVVCRISIDITPGSIWDFVGRRSVWRALKNSQSARIRADFFGPSTAQCRTRCPEKYKKDVTPQSQLPLHIEKEVDGSYIGGGGGWEPSFTENFRTHAEQPLHDLIAVGERISSFQPRAWCPKVELCYRCCHVTFQSLINKR